MKIIILLFIILLFISGCEFIAPNVSKAITEQQQYEELQKQNIILIDIANTLKLIANNSKEKCTN